MYDARRYVDVNVGGTAALMDAIGSFRERRVARLVVASSRAVYGEGQYHCERDGNVYPRARFADDLSTGVFDPRCPACGGPIHPEPTAESAPFAPTSVYGLTKQSQEQLALMVAPTLELDAVALRYQNVYGPGQSLINPYTGILATFSNLARQGRDLNVFEDGLESRDFVFVDDVVAMNLLCLHGETKVAGPLNVGSGVATTIAAVAEGIVAHFGKANEIRVSGDFRVGDIRHAFADTRAMRRISGDRATTAFSDGLRAFLAWAETHTAGRGHDRSIAELRQRGLLRGTR
jgi:dTDP-L-rhamnose 4-epimerase